MNATDARIAVVPIGEGSHPATKAIAAHIVGYLNVAADILSPMASPSYAFDERRGQYNAASILQALDSERFPGYEKVIAVVELDLFVPIFTYVFGEAKQGGRQALISLCRLKAPMEDPASALSLEMERASKVAVHELGHLYNLHHCTDERCLMRFAGSLEELDRTPFYFCRYCAVYFHEALFPSSRRES